MEVGKSNTWDFKTLFIKTGVIQLSRKHLLNLSYKKIQWTMNKERSITNVKIYVEILKTKQNNAIYI